MTPSGREKRGLSLTKFLPTIISGLECIGKEEKISKCAVGAVKDVATVLANENFRTSAPGSTIPIPNVSQVSCTGEQLIIIIKCADAFYVHWLFTLHVF